MAKTDEKLGKRGLLTTVALVGLLTAAILAIFVFAPLEKTMGAAQRIIYIHVSVAWFGLLSFLAMAAAGLMYLVRRDLSWDHWAQASAEVGWLCCGLTLVTGSFWARAAWGTWWTWDPRLTASFVLWALYCGCLLVRGGVEDPHRRARLGAVLAILGGVDIPLVMMATRWFRGMHPVSPGMEPAMRVVLLISVIAFTALFAALVARRRADLQIESVIATLENAVEA